MTPNEFDALLQQGYNRIPVVREVLADLDTPLSVYLKLVDGPFGFLFESVQGGEKWGRYSIIGLPCRTILRVHGDQVDIETHGETVEQATVDDPLAFIEAFKARFRVPELEGLPRFSGGLVGYFGYDTVGFIEPRLRNPEKPDPLACPDILLMVSDEVVVFDNLSTGRREAVLEGELVVDMRQDSGVGQVRHFDFQAVFEPREALQQAGAVRVDSLVCRDQRLQGVPDAGLPIDQGSVAVEGQHLEIGQRAGLWVLHELNIY